MFWSLRENLGGLSHIGALLDRIVAGRKREYYVERALRLDKALEGNLSVVRDDLDNPLTCRFCGLAIMSYRVSPDYSITQCSSLVAKLPRGQEFGDWLASLPRAPNKDEIAIG